MAATYAFGDTSACLVSRRFAHRLAALTVVVAAMTCGASSYAWVSLATGSAPFFWRYPTVAYTINDVAHPGISDGSDVTAVRLAFQQWQQVPGCTIGFWEDTNPAARSRTDWRSDDISLVLWDSTNESGFFTPGTGLVAITPVDFDTRSGEIIDADILFNGTKPFSTNGEGGAFDIQNIATHEVGHFIGLDHSAVVGSTMNPFAYTGDTRLRSLAADDLAGANTLYPAAGEPASIQGFVRLSGTAISGAHVVAEDESGRPASATLSDGNGFFRIRGLDAGNYVVYAEPLDGPVSSANFSLHTSNLRIDTGFGTTFWGASGGRSNPVDPDRVAVSYGQRVDVGEVTLLGSSGINITSVGPNTVAPGGEVQLTITGANVGQNPLQRAVVVPSVFGDIQVMDSSYYGASTAYASIYVSPSARPHLATVRVIDTATWACSVFTGGFEVRDSGPVATGLSSAEGQPGATVTLSGDRFDSGARVLFGAVVVAAQISGTAATFSVPDGVADGAYSVTIENPDGQFAKLTGAFHVVGSTAAPSDGSSPPPPDTGTATPAAAPPRPTASSGGGGGGGCALAPVEAGPTAPAAPLLLLVALLGLGVARRRVAG